MNLFEKSTREKYRFESEKGIVSVEQLWDMKLTDLDKVARKVNSELKSVTEESFVNISPDSRKPVLENKLDILKHIIEVKMKEVSDQKQAAEKAEKRRVLLDALSSKENEEINNMSKEDILKELEAL